MTTSSASYDRSSATRFPAAVDTALRTAGWEPGRWDIKQAEFWADALRDHTTPAGHRHTVFPAAVEAWAEFGGLTVTAPGPGRQIAPVPVRLDPLTGLHLARTFADLGRALSTELCPSASTPTPARTSPSTAKAASTASTTPATGTSAAPWTKP